MISLRSQQRLTIPMFALESDQFKMTTDCANNSMRVQSQIERKQEDGRDSSAWKRQKNETGLRARVSYISELDEAELAEVRDGLLRGLDGDDELHEAHLLPSHMIHRRQPIEDLHPSSHRLEARGDRDLKGISRKFKGRFGLGRSYGCIPTNWFLTEVCRLGLLD